METAEEFFRNKLRELYPNFQEITLASMLITAEQGMRWGHEYSILKAKFYVKEALQQAGEKVSYKETCTTPYACSTCKNDICEKPIKYVEQSDILNAYPLENIK